MSEELLQHMLVRAGIIERLDRMLTLLESINARLGASASGGTGSVEIRTSTRGVDVTVKAYCVRPEVPVSLAGTEAMNEFVRVNQELTRAISGV